MKFCKKLIASILLVLISFTLFNITPTESAVQYTVTDNFTGTLYTVTADNEDVTVHTNSKDYCFSIDDEIIGITSFDSVLTFLCIDDNGDDSYIYSVRIYDLKSEHFYSFATNYKSVRKDIVFTADDKGTVYLLDSYTKRTLYCYNAEGNNFNISCPAEIKQMMYTSENDVLLFTFSGVYVIEDNVSEKISDITPVTPCKYSGSGIITDDENTQYRYCDGVFDVMVPETTAANTEITDVDSDTIIAIDEEKSYLYISAGTTFAKLYKALGIARDELSVVKTDGSTVNSGKLGTGMTAAYNNARFYLIIFGDLTGEGNINSRDLKLLMKHLTGEALLSEVYAEAADLDKDGTLTTKDLLMLANLY